MSGSKDDAVTSWVYSFNIWQIYFHNGIRDTAFMNLVDVHDRSCRCVFQVVKQFFPAISKMAILAFRSFNAVSHRASYLYTSSARTISSARLRMLFMAPTHASWSRAFSSSVTPSASCICETIHASQSAACSSRSARYVQSFPDRSSALY